MKPPYCALACMSLASVHVGCSTGAPARPEDQAPVSAAQPGDRGYYPAQPTASPPAVGPAPLRRLSDREYLNALTDTFPGLSPTLPALPADLAGAGFDNAVASQQPSDVLIARYESIANLYAQAATADATAVSALVGCADWSTPALATSCATAFIESMGSRLFRRPITADERDRLVLRFQGWQSAVDFEGAVQLTLSTMLQSPQFIYRAEPVSPTLPPGSIVAVEQYAMASRLSFLLWESVPDEVLLGAASRSELGTEDQLRAQATRMLADDRARRVFWSFTRQWLGLDRILLAENAVRTAQVDPAWTAATQAAASQETELFVENVLTEGGSLRSLLTSERAWVNGEMARIYGLPSPADPTVWTEVALPKAERAGLLTRASFLAGFSHPGATSPPVRGNGIQLRFLCELPLSPPPGVDLSQPMPAPDAGPQTNRMLFEARTAPPSCQVCHAGLNGFGFGLESYNAAGRYQTTDNGLPVDATGTLIGTDVDGPFNGGIALSSLLSESRTVHDCATQKMVLYALGRPPVDVETAWVGALAESLMQSGGDVRGLLMDIATSPTFRLRQVEEN